MSAIEKDRLGRGSSSTSAFAFRLAKPVPAWDAPDVSSSPAGVIGLRSIDCARWSVLLTPSADLGVMDVARSKVGNSFIFGTIVLSVSYLCALLAAFRGREEPSFPRRTFFGLNMHCHDSIDSSDEMSSSCTS